MFSISSKIFRNIKTIQKLTAITFRDFHLTENLLAGEVQCLGDNVKKGLILGMYLNDTGEPVLTPACCKFNEKMQGKLLELIVRSGKWSCKMARSFNNIEDEYWSVSVVCLGKKDVGYNQLEAIEESREAVRACAGAGAQLLYDQRVNQIYVEGLGRPEQAAEGVFLAIWRYQEFKNKTRRQVIPTVELFDEPDQDSWQKGMYLAESQNLSRRLCDAPANHLTPTAFSHEVVNALCPCGIKVDIHDKDWIENQRLVGILHAAKGSCEPPIFIEMFYCGGPVEERPVVLIGKGTTFDTGGLCLHRCKGMAIKRADMSGASAVVGVMRCAAMLSLPLNLVGILPLTENMASGMAMRCGDILKFNNGKTVEIENTSLEGHLVVGDTLIFAQQFHKPRLIIDVTTQCFGTQNLLGSSGTATFTNSEFMWKQMRKAGVITGDRMWRLPLWKFYKRRVCEYRYVDLNNVGQQGLRGNPCIGAAFLSFFVDCVDWIHLDTYGTGSTCRNRIYPYYTENYMTGRPIRTIVQFLYQISCPNDCDQPY